MKLISSISLFFNIPKIFKKKNQSYKFIKKLEIKYIQNMLKDLEIEKKNITHKKIYSIFIGGEYLHLFKNINTLKLLKKIKSKINIMKKTEISLEINPNYTNFKTINKYIKTGINRLTFNVKTFNTYFLKNIDKKNKKTKIIFLIKKVLKRNINLNLDIIYGFPNQSFKSAIKDLKISIKLNPNHITWYQYDYENPILFHISKKKSQNIKI